MDLAQEAAGRGDFDQATALFERADLSLQSALHVGTSDAELHLDRASLYWTRMLSEITNRGHDVEPFFKEGLASVEGIADGVESVTVPLDESLAALKECTLHLSQRQT